MLRIRLARRGAVHRPFYRVVVNDSALTPDSRNVEEIGFYDPRKSPAVLELDVEKAEGWIKKGAVPSPRVKAFIKTVKARGQSPAQAPVEKAPLEAAEKADPVPAATEPPAEAESKEEPS